MVKRVWVILVILAFLLVGCAQQQETTLVWYNVLPAEAAAKLVAAFEETHPNIKIESVRGTSSETVQRHNEEREAGQVRADLLQHNDVAVFNQWCEDGVLMNYNSPEAANYPAEVQNEGCWVALRAFATVLAYNPDLVERPSSWLDLLKPEYKGKIALPDPRTAGDALQLYWLLRELHGPEYWEAMGQQDVSFHEGVVAMAEQVITGEDWFSINVGYRVVDFRDVQGAPIDMAFPEEGTLVVASPLAIAEGAPNPDEAKILFDWLLSEAGQEVVVNEMKQLSVRLGGAVTPGLPPVAEIKIAEVNQAEINENREMLLDEFRGFFGLEQ